MRGAAQIEKASEGGGYLEAIDGEQAAEDAFLEAGAEHNHIILFIHGAAAGALSKRSSSESSNEGRAAGSRSNLPRELQ